MTPDKCSECDVELVGCETDMCEWCREHDDDLQDYLENMQE